MTGSPPQGLVLQSDILDQLYLSPPDGSRTRIVMWRIAAWRRVGVCVGPQVGRAFLAVDIRRQREVKGV